MQAETITQLKSQDEDHTPYGDSFILSIAEGISRAKNRAAMASVIHLQLTKWGGFNYGILGLPDNSGDHFLNFIIGNDGIMRRTSDTPIPYSETPATIELKELLSKFQTPALVNLHYSGNPALLPDFLRAISFRKCMQVAIACLAEEKEVIGYLILFFDEVDNFSNKKLHLLGVVASQLSSAGSRIIAKEEIRKRENDKLLLLAFSNHLATVKDTTGLQYILKQSLREMFCLEEFIITIKNPGNSDYSYFSHDLSAEAPKDEGFKIITGEKMPVKGSLTGAVLKSDDPVIFDVTDIFRTRNYSFPAGSFWKAAGAEKILGIRLKVAGDDIGILWIRHGKLNERLLKGISAQIAIALANVLANKKLESQQREIQQYKLRLDTRNAFQHVIIEPGHETGEMIGAGPEMGKIFDLLSKVAFADTTVLLLGETGTGKELLANAIHLQSPRRDQVMVKVNCAGLPANLVESELFGHERGSFTGAFEQKIGKFELANHGTLFLDEVGEMPLELQMKVLRALQEREIERVGGKKTIKINVRIIAATNRDLYKEVLEGRFRSDLFYRLNVFPIIMPPLRRRVEDIPLLANHFLKKLSVKIGKQVVGIAQPAMQELINHSWPGNIRELEHVIERSLLLSTGNSLKVHLPRHDHKSLPDLNAQEFKTLGENERDHIISALKICHGKIFGSGGAAGILGIPPSTLNYKMKILNIKKCQLYNDQNFKKTG